MITRESVINLTYWQEYQDPEDHDFFKIHHTIFRNVPLSQLKRLNDKNFKETASNYNDYSEVNVITGDEYYKTYGDEYGYDGHMGENDFFEDYGQKWDTRQFFKHDFNKEITKFMGGIK